MILFWTALLLSVVAWPFVAGAPGIVAAVAVALSLIAPLPGLYRGTRRTLRWAPLTLAPVLAVALTEFLVRAPGRAAVGVTLALLPAAFAALIAALRTAPAGDA